MILRKNAAIVFLGCSFLRALQAEESAYQLMEDLKQIEKIEKKLTDTLPLFYNFSMMGGYLNMPSARMAKEGTVAFGGGTATPYNVYGLNLQVLDRIELSANYRVYSGIEEPGFGSLGFGDDADRTGNIKIGVLTPSEDLPLFPLISFGAEDFIGTKRFNAQYIVATKQFLNYNFECSLGWGNGRIKGWFGGFAWSPFRNQHHFFKNITIQAEYDANDYKEWESEHPEGRVVKSRINAGISLLALDALQLSFCSIRGEKFGFSASLRQPLGSTSGFFPKTADPKPYRTPIDTEPLGSKRKEAEFVHEIAYAFSEQGLDLYTAYLDQTTGKKNLWIRVVNNRYRDHLVVKERIMNILSALIPSDIQGVTVVIEATALDCQSYYFRTEDLYRYRLGLMGPFELKALSPMKEVGKEPTTYEAMLLFRRVKPIWTFTFRPRLISFFGSVHGKFKYNLSLTAYPEGYLFDKIYYKTQLSYSLYSNSTKMSGVDYLNPSHMFVVRSDSMKYFQTNSIHLDQAFLQRSWNLGKGFFYRIGAGYFEVAYAGVATEALFYPAGSNFAAGLEFATVWKRKYDGLGFFQKVAKFDGTTVEYFPFTGIQYFLDLYYDFKPMSLDFKVTAGQFLAKDMGARLEVGRYFASGMRFSLWYSWTNANEELNGHKYHDKGFAFLLPLDMFLRQSSRNFIGYAMAAWLRDQAAQASTGKTLYSTLSEERFFP